MAVDVLIPNYVLGLIISLRFFAAETVVKISKLKFDNKWAAVVTRKDI